jgi:hypothetical protein
MPVAHSRSFPAAATILRRRLVTVPCAVLILILAAACTYTAPQQAPSVVQGVRPASGEFKVLLMPPDIECSELTATGLLEPRADWTTDAKRNVQEALDELFAMRRTDLVTYEAAKLSPEQRRQVDRIMKLNDAVSASISTSDALPTKRNRFEWSLGAGVRRLKEDFGADYALFIVIRDSYASTGRKAMMALDVLASLAAAISGGTPVVAVEGGRQLGIASLVDLETGDVVWFNRLHSETGDIRSREPAVDAMQDLMTGCPV